MTMRIQLPKQAVVLTEEDGRGGHAVARVTYRLNPPIEGYDWEIEEEGGEQLQHSIVAVSQANVPMSGWETYIFPAREDGEVTDWGELPGSRRGFVSPDDLMRELGYAIAREVEENDGN